MRLRAEQCSASALTTLKPVFKLILEVAPTLRQSHKTTLLGQKYNIVELVSKTRHRKEKSVGITKS
jgi:hypothetical protein